MSGRLLRTVLRFTLCALLVLLGLGVAPPAQAAAGAGVDDAAVIAAGESGNVAVLSNDVTAPPGATIELVAPVPTWASTFDSQTIDVDLFGNPTTSGSLTVSYNVLDDTLAVVGTATLTVYVVPRALTIQGGNASATLTWAGLPAGITGARISYGTSPLFAHDGTATIKAGTGPWTINGLTNGTSYYFYVTPRAGSAELEAGESTSVRPRAANSPPTAVADLVSLLPADADRTFYPTDNDTDPDLDDLTVIGHSAPSHGAVDCLGGFSCTYTPSGAHVDDSFTYTISDGYGGEATATVTIKARTGVAAVDDNATTSAEEPLAVDVLANDTNVLATDQVDVSGTSSPDLSAYVDEQRRVVVESATPGNYTATYQVLTEQSDLLATATVSVTIGAKRVLVAFPDEVSTNIGHDSDFEVWENDRFDLNDSFPFSNAQSSITVAPQHGSATLSFEPRDVWDPAITDYVLRNVPVVHYHPNPLYHGPDSLTYHLQDALGNADNGVVTITVTTDAPYFVDASQEIGRSSLSWANSPSTQLDQVQVCWMRGNDRTTVPPTPTRPCANTVPVSGLAEATPFEGMTNDRWYVVAVFAHYVDGTPGGVWSDPAETEIRPGVQEVRDLWTETAADHVQVSWRAPYDTTPTGYTVGWSTTSAPATPGTGLGWATVPVGTTQYDITGLTASTTYYISVFSTAPATFGDPVSTSVLTAPGNIAPTVGNDFATTDDVTPIDIPVLANDTDPNGDPLTIRAHTDPAKGFVDCSESSCTYYPDLGEGGTFTFLYTVSDGRFGILTAQVSVTVTTPPKPPVADNDTMTVTVGNATPIDLTLLTYDLDSPTLTYTVVTPPASGTLLSPTDGKWTYTGAVVGDVSFTYRATDGSALHDDGIVTLHVVANQAPVVDHVIETSAAPGVTVPVNAAAVTSDPDGDPITYAVDTVAQKGTASCNAAGACTYHANANATGSDSFTFKATDSHNASTIGSVLITITSNSPPNVGNDVVTTPLNTAIPVNVAANDSDPDGDTLVFTKTSDPLHGTASCTAAGVCTYTPTAGYFGGDSFTYSASDGTNEPVTGTVSVTVTKAAGPVLTLTRAGALARSVLSKVTFSGSANPGVAGQLVSLQRKVGTGWSTIATVAAGTPAAGKSAYSFSLKQTTGSYTYRVTVAETATTRASSSLVAVPAAFYQVRMLASSAIGDQYVTIKNTGKVSVQLKGWTITTKTGRVLTLPTRSLAPGKSVRVHPGSGTNNAGNLYLKKGKVFALHDTLKLKDLLKVVVAKRTW